MNELENVLEEMLYQVQYAPKGEKTKVRKMWAKRLTKMIRDLDD